MSPRRPKSSLLAAEEWPRSLEAPVRDTFWDHGYRDGSHRRHWAPTEVPRELVALVEDGRAPAGAVAVDLGCGAGREARYLARAGLRVLGVDTSGVALALARRRQLDVTECNRDQDADDSTVGITGRVTWLKADVLTLPLAPESVDLALDRGLFHLLEDPQRRRYAEEVHRVLAPGGLLLLRGARRGDEEAGLFPVDARAVAGHFHREHFEVGSLTPVSLRASEEDLAGHSVVVGKRRRR